MSIKHGLMMLVSGAFLTYFWNPSTPVFDPLPFGIALLLASAFVLASDIVLRLPHRELARTFARDETVLPARRG